MLILDSPRDALRALATARTFERGQQARLRTLVRALIDDTRPSMPRLRDSELIDRCSALENYCRRIQWHHQSQRALAICVVESFQRAELRWRDRCAEFSAEDRSRRERQREAWRQQGWSVP